MHVIIIGAGPAGLAAYLSLRQNLAPETTSTILERHVSTATNRTSTFAGALGIAPNGMRAIKQLSPSLHDKIQSTGCETSSFRFQTAAGWTLGFWNMVSRRDAQAYNTVMIDRQTLWKLFRNEIPENLVREGAKVVEVRSEGVVVLQSGEEIRGDLIIGADGIRSVVRRTIIPEGEPGRDATAIDVMDIGGNLPAAYIKDAGASSTTMTFGKTGFLGYAVISSGETTDGPSAVWWSTCHGDGSKLEVSNMSLNDTHLVEQLVDKYGDWNDPVVEKLLADLKDRKESSPTTIGFAASKVSLASLSRWSKGRVVLVGDAAHALPSSSGQGVSMAFEDALVLSMVLKRAWIASSSGMTLEEIEQAGEEYYQMRKDRVFKIKEDGERSQAKKKVMSFIEAAIMYTILWVLIKVGVNDSWKFDYDARDLFSEAKV